MNISVILNTCNRSRFLELSLLALMNQTYKDFEVIIADDGSTDTTPDVIRQAKVTAPFPITHIWQNRDGHGRTLILNKGITAAQCDYIFFTDCDVLAPPDLLRTHWTHRSPNRFLLGGMIRMSMQYSESLGLEDVAAGRFLEQMTRDEMRRLRRRRRKANFQLFLRRRRKPHINATNMSMSKTALLQVNGFDENYRGWGNADGDLRERLKMAGYSPKVIYDEAIVFHLYHEPDPTASLRLNREYSKRRNIAMRCLNGIEKISQNTR